MWLENYSEKVHAPGGSESKHFLTTATCLVVSSFEIIQWNKAKYVIFNELTNYR